MTDNRTTHTPGPWAPTKYVLNLGRVVTRAEHLGRPYGAGVDAEKCRKTYMQPIAHISQHPCHLSGGIPEAEANAHLIAAAPDLYEALKAILDQQDIDGVGGGRITITLDYRSPLAEQARAALAKAEGRQS